MEATGLGRGSLYAAFGGKHQMYLEALDRYCLDYEESLDDALGGSDEGAYGRLQAYLANPEHCALQAGEYLVCMAGRSAMELGSCDVDVTSRVDRNFTVLESALREAIEAAQRAGDFDRDADAGDAATVILVLLKGIDIVARTGRSPEDLRPLVGAVMDRFATHRLAFA
ncbi:hypothetical protein GCM10022256_16240 [Frondihabitans peucedani]|uniref:Tetracyclin repressor-like C-terminal domain-containing protein n=1 Tax=Frondihabitans peucedani TaxID=598626 RepID=A0ABP8E1C5_9MICO